MVFDVPEGTQLAAIVGALAARSPRPPLLAAAPALPEVLAGVNEKTIGGLSGAPAPDASGARALAAALHLWNDDVPRALECLASDEGPLSLYLQSVLHRRQGDWATAREWACLAGPAPFAADLRTAAMTILWERPEPLAKRLHLALRSLDGWPAEAFVGWVSSYRAEEEDWAALREPLERIQEIELALLAYAAYRAALVAPEGAAGP